MNIGPAIKTVRKRLSMTQADLADRCYMSQSALSCIESGEKIPKSHTIERICSVLNVPEGIIYLMGMQEADVVEQKKDVFKVVHPMIKLLALQIAQKGAAEVIRPKHQPAMVND